jgi:hypothetical protein
MVALRVSIDFLISMYSISQAAIIIVSLFSKRGLRHACADETAEVVAIRGVLSVVANALIGSKSAAITRKEMEWLRLKRVISEKDKK